MNTKSSSKTARRLRRFGIAVSLIALVCALALGALSAGHWISLIEKMLGAHVDNPSDFVGLEALVNSALTHDLTDSVNAATLPPELNDLLSDIESQLSTSAYALRQTQPCKRSNAFELMPSVRDSDNPIDSYVTETESSNDSTFLYLPTGLIRVPPGGNPIRALECDPLLLNDIDRTRAVSDSLRKLTTFTLTDQAARQGKTLYIVQTYITTVRGLLRVTETTSVAPSQRKYYEGQFEPNVFFARTNRFKEVVSKKHQKPVLEKGQAHQVKDYFNVSDPYLDLGGNGVVTTICRALSIESDRDSSLCLDVSDVNPNEASRLPEVQSALEKLGATKLQGACRIKKATDRDFADCDETFGSYRKLLENTINQQLPSKLSTVFGQLKLVQTRPDQFLFTIPVRSSEVSEVKSSETPKLNRQQTLLLWRITLMGLKLKGFSGPVISGILILGAALVAFIVYKQWELDRFEHRVDIHSSIIDGKMLEACCCSAKQK